MIMAFRLRSFFFLMMVVVAGVAGGARPATATLPTIEPHSGRELVVCKNTAFALCAASTCTPTGGTIRGNDGRRHPAVSCTCPVLVGDNIADLRGGNMDGSCTAPDGFVWSTYEFNDSYPQDIDGTWETAPAMFQVCPASDEFSQCWNWKCALGDVVNGVQLAECTCPMEKSPFQFVTQAGQGDPAACADIPVGGPLFFDPSSMSAQP
jgi:hypothetical protein